MDLWPFDVRRFGAPHSVKRFMYERAVESYGRYYHVAWPNCGARRRARRAAQPAACAARTPRTPCTATSSAGSGPNWFAPRRNAEPVEAPSFERGAAFEAIGAEHEAVRERVAHRST